MARPKALFVAGSFAQARYWARQLGFEPRDWIYVAPHSIKGVRGIPIYLVGTPHWREDWPEILDALAPVGELIDGQEMVPPHEPGPVFHGA